MEDTLFSTLREGHHASLSYTSAIIGAVAMIDVWLALAAAVLVAHLLFNLWVVLGAGVTRGRPKLAALHIGSVLYGTAMENSPWSCPLTLAEKCFKARAGLTPYEGPFVLHYLETVVAPNFSIRVLRWGAVGVALLNLAVYSCRYVRTHHRAVQP